MFGLGQIGKLGAIGKAIASAWSPLALWPNGAASPGMWIDPSLLTASFNDYAGTTPVATPGSVADSANPVGLALDIRAGAPDTLGPELVTNGDFSSGATGWTIGAWTVSGGTANVVAGVTDALTQGITITSGKTYEISFTIVSVSGGGLQPTLYGGSWNFGPVLSAIGVNTCRLVAGAGNTEIRFFKSVAGVACSIDNISVREIPGNHMLQATSAARPLESARVNLLTYSEDFSNAVWLKKSVTFVSNVMTKTINPFSEGCLQISIPATATGVKSSVSAIASAGSAGAYLYLRNIEINDAVPAGLVQFDLSAGTVAYQGSAYSAVTISQIAGGKWLCTATGFDVGVTAAIRFDIGISDTVGSVGCAIGKYINIFSAQYQLGNPSAYQRVGAASDYTATGFPQYLKFDGVDDALSSATFAAGTLTSSMDCLIAVRRDSAANAVCGLYNAVADATKFFGMAESASGSGCVGSGAGTPTVWVDNTQLTGGTAVTRGTLHTALTAGSYHILEFRNLDLSAWTATGFGRYTSYVFPGARGDIMLFESTASTADKDAARQYLADKYGVTLP